MTRPAVVVAERLLDVRTGWAGWVRPDAPERFAAVAAAAAAQTHPGPARWVTWRHANRTAVAALWPRFDVAALVRTLDHLLAGHVLATEVLAAARPGDDVVCEVAPMPVYEVGRLLEDLLAAPANGVARADLGQWIAGRRAAFDAAVAPPGGPFGRGLRAWSAAAIAGERAMPRAVGAVFEAACRERPTWPTSGPAAGSSWPRTRPGR